MSTFAVYEVAAVIECKVFNFSFWAFFEYNLWSIQVRLWFGSRLSRNLFWLEIYDEILSVVSNVKFLLKVSQRKISKISKFIELWKLDTFFPSPLFFCSRCADGTDLRKWVCWWTLNWVVHCDMLWHESELFFLSVPGISFTHFPFQGSTRNRNVHGQTRLLYAKRHFRASHVGISSLTTKQLQMKFLSSEFGALLKKTQSDFTYFSLRFLSRYDLCLCTVCSSIFEWKSS